MAYIANYRTFNYGARTGFEFMFTTHHIFTVLPIKDLINQYGEPTTPQKLETGT